jgi:hypothetical protein
LTFVLTAIDALSTIDTLPTIDTLSTINVELVSSPVSFEVDHHDVIELAHVLSCVV